MCEHPPQPQELWSLAVNPSKEDDISDYEVTPAGWLNIHTAAINCGDPRARGLLKVMAMGQEALLCTLTAQCPMHSLELHFLPGVPISFHTGEVDMDGQMHIINKEDDEKEESEDEEEEVAEKKKRRRRGGRQERERRERLAAKEPVSKKKKKKKEPEGFPDLGLPNKKRAARLERREIRMKEEAKKLYAADVLLVEDGLKSNLPTDERPKLRVEDLKLGDQRKLVEKGDHCGVHYVGRLSTGQTFDESKGHVFKLRMGAGKVVQGFERGIMGMGVGGKRRITIPPHLGFEGSCEHIVSCKWYGAAGSPPVIPPNSTLVFDVTLVNKN